MFNNAPLVLTATHSGHPWLSCIQAITGFLERRIHLQGPLECCSGIFQVSRLGSLFSRAEGFHRKGGKRDVQEHEESAREARKTERLACSLPKFPFGSVTRLLRGSPCYPIDHSGRIVADVQSSFRTNDDPNGSSHLLALASLFRG